MLTAITLSPFRHTSSLPPRVQSGSDPFSGETFHRLRLGSGNDCAYTSTRPDSSESYAIHRPSGESAGCARLTPLAKYGADRGSPRSGTVQSSEPPGTLSTKANRLPSAETLPVERSNAPARRGRAGPAPSAA